MEIQVHGEDIERAIRDLKRMVQKDGIFVELRQRDRSHKASDRRKLKAVIAEGRRRKKNGKIRNI